VHVQRTSSLLHTSIMEWYYHLDKWI
jgi:hypothetical protein